MDGPQREEGRDGSGDRGRQMLAVGAAREAGIRENALHGRGSSARLCGDDGDVRVQAADSATQQKLT